jgi:hypothetical protein
MRGALAFWYVDGALFAFKDSASYLLAFFIFGVTALVGTPVTRSIALQGLDPDTPERTEQMQRLLNESSVVRAMKQSALLIGITTEAQADYNWSSRVSAHCQLIFPTGA